jgi:hypothetical protein
VTVKVESTDPRLKEWGRLTIVQTKSHVPVVAQLLDFAPGPYSYTIKTENDEILAQDVFEVPDPTKRIRTIVVSCNALHTLKKGDVDLWASMLEHHSTQTGLNVDMILHIGDQIYEYNREVWQRCYKYFECIQIGKGKTTGKELMKVDQELDFCEWSLEKNHVYTMADVMELVKEMFRSLYRQSWNHPPQKAIMSRVSNQMILDDHDIRNGWGILEEDKNPETIEYQLGQCAHSVYEEYQVQLWRDIDPNFHVDYRVLRRSNSAVFIMDVRNPRTFCYHENAPYVGPEQMNGIEKLLKDPTLKNLLLVCSIPIIMGSEFTTGLAACFDVTYDIRDSWSIPEHRPEHLKLLRLLEAWRREDPSRKLTLVGGDIHFALYSVITGEKDFLICDQVVTSPITNEPTKGVIAKLQDLFAGTNFTLYKQFKVQHKYRLHARNYAEIWDSPDGWSYCFHTESDK